MDYYLFTLINSLAGRFAIADMIGIFFARTAIFLLPFFAFVEAKTALQLFARMTLSTVLAFSTNALIGFLYFRPRPFAVHDVHQLITLHYQNSKSFPSDHTAIAFALAATVAILYPRIGMGALIVAFLVGLARVFVGVHYPFDILGGALVGIFSAFVVHFFSLRFGVL